MDLLKQPETRRLLQSAQVALPLTEDPLGDLAAGLRMERAAAAEMLKALQREGAVAGVRGEPNPQLAEARVLQVEAAAESPSGGHEEVIRWAGRAPDGRWWWSAMRLAAKGTERPARFFKAGFLLSFEDGPERLLDAARERSLFVGEELVELPQLPGDAARLADALFQPLLFNPEVDLWEQLARKASIQAPGVRPALKHLLQTGVFRRFALALSPAALGWKGCGLASWEFAESEHAMAAEAGRALAALRGTGDVMYGHGANGPGRLQALFLAREPGAGGQAAGEIARQWGRPLAEWTPLDIRPA